MTSEYQLTRQAGRDILEIIEDLAERSPAAADDLERAPFAAFATVAEHPQLGHLRPDLTRLPVRFTTVSGRYLVVHNGAGPVVILRVLSAWRDVGRLL